MHELLLRLFVRVDKKVIGQFDETVCFDHIVISAGGSKAFGASCPPAAEHLISSIHPDSFCVNVRVGRG